MTHRKNVNASLENVKTQFGEAQSATKIASICSDTLHVRLGALLERLQGVLDIQPISPDLTWVWIDSVQDAQSKTSTAHDSLAKVAEGTSEGSPLAEALDASSNARGALAEEETAAGTMDVAEITARIEEQINVLYGAYDALMMWRASVGVVKREGTDIAAYHLAEVVPKIEEHQQRL